MVKQLIDHRIVVTLVSIVLFMEFLDSTIINNAIPSIANNFHLNPILLKFAVASYFLSLAVFIPISGWCTDRFGTKKIFLWSVTLFTVASMLCGISTSIVQLTIFRFLQGIGGAFMNPVARIIIVRLFPPKQILRVQGIIFTPALLGQILGPVLGGLITNYISWRWIFYINVPIGLIVLYFANIHIIQVISKTIKRFDFLGFFLAAIALSAITFCVEMLFHVTLVSSNTTLTIGSVGIIFFAALIYHCQHKKHPVLDFSLLKIKTFKVGFCIHLSIYSVGAAVAFLLPLMYQSCFGFSPAYSGLLVAPIAVGYLSFRSIAAKVITRYGFKNILTVAAVPLTILMILLGSITRTTTVPYIVLIEFCYGVTFIMIGASTGALNYIDMPKDKAAAATSIDMTFRQFASSVGVGSAAMLLTAFAQFTAVPMFTHQVFQMSFAALSILILLTIFSSLKLDNTDKQ